jgi:hypothetical protein
MSVSSLLAALEEYLAAKKDFMNGMQTEDNLNLQKKVFAQTLNEYIDYRAEGVMEGQRRKISTDASIKIADILTGHMDGEVSSAIAALNCAPMPPTLHKQSDNESLTDWLSALKELENWADNYRQWYEHSRKDGLNS